MTRKSIKKYAKKYRIIDLIFEIELICEELTKKKREFEEGIEQLNEAIMNIKEN